MASLRSGGLAPISFNSKTWSNRANNLEINPIHRTPKKREAIRTSLFWIISFDDELQVTVPDAFRTKN